jgi:hypothetical protein
MGYGIVIYLAKITGIDQEMYEAARIDGANRVAKENEYKLAIAALGFAGGTILQDLQLEEPEGGTK